MEEHLTPSTLQGVFKRNFDAKRFLVYLKGYFHQGATRYSAVWLSGAPDGKARSDLRLNDFKTVLTGQRQSNHLLRSVSGYQLDGDVAYAGVWEA